jgi:putative FmdB family regulatory protein
MPIYEYQCNKCSQVSEILTIGKENSPACSACGSGDLTKLMSAHNTIGSTPSFAAAGDCSSCASSNGCGAPGACGTMGGCCCN